MYLCTHIRQAGEILVLLSQTGRLSHIVTIIVVGSHKDNKNSFVYITHYVTRLVIPSYKLDIPFSHPSSALDNRDDTNAHMGPACILGDLVY
jgi:hypothetical protein